MRDPYRKIITKEKISSVRFEKKKNPKQTKPPINQPIKKKSNNNKKIQPTKNKPGKIFPSSSG